MKMKWKKQEEGEMGIGTMIVFIALVLVAAIAAGMLVDSANLIGQQSQNTANKGAASVKSALKILSITGDRDRNSDGDNTYLENLYVRIEPVAGSSRIHLNEVSIEIITASAYKTPTMNTTSGFSKLTFDNNQGVTADDVGGHYGPAGTAGSFGHNGTYGVDEITDKEGVWTFASAVYGMLPGTIIQLNFNLTARSATLDGGLEIPTGDLAVGKTITIKLTPKDGVPTYATVTLPSVFTTEEMDLI